MTEQSLLFRIAWLAGAINSDPEAQVAPSESPEDRLWQLEEALNGRR